MCLSMPCVVLEKRWRVYQEKKRVKHTLYMCMCMSQKQIKESACFGSWVAWSAKYLCTTFSRVYFICLSVNTPILHHDFCCLLHFWLLKFLRETPDQITETNLNLRHVKVKQVKRDAQNLHLEAEGILLRVKKVYIVHKPAPGAVELEKETYLNSSLPTIQETCRENHCTPLLPCTQRVSTPSFW